MASLAPLPNSVALLQPPPSGRRTPLNKATTTVVNNQAYDDRRQIQALIRRVLTTQENSGKQIEDTLPALTSSSRIDLQLYAIIAIICRYVFSVLLLFSFNFEL